MMMMTTTTYDLASTPLPPKCCAQTWNAFEIFNDDYFHNLKPEINEMVA